MAFDPNELDSENTPMRWRIQGKRLADSGVEGAAEAAKLDDVYEAVLNRAATFTSDEELGIGNQPGVGGPAEPEPPVLVNDITVSGYTTPLDLNATGDPDTVQLTAEVLPADAADKTVTWTSSAPAVATVSPAGLVEALAVGTTQVRATANDGSGTYGYASVEVGDTTV